MKTVLHAEDEPHIQEVVRLAPEDVFKTAKVQSHEIDRYKALDALGGIASPFDPMTLAAEVRQIFEKGDVDL